MKTRNCSRQDAKSAKFGSLFPGFLRMTPPSLCGPFDLAQDMLCAFAGDIPIFGCGFAGLGLCGENFFTRNPEEPNLLALMRRSDSRRKLSHE